MDVALDVVEKLDQFGTHIGGVEDILGQSRKDLGGHLLTPGILRADDLRQRPQFFVGLTLGDPFRAEGKHEITPHPHAGTALEPTPHIGGGARCDGAAQDQQLPRSKVGLHALKNLLDVPKIAFDVVVKGRTDGNDQGPGPLHHLGIGLHLKAPAGSQFLVARLVERHGTAVDGIGKLAVDIDPCTVETGFDQ